MASLLVSGLLRILDDRHFIKEEQKRSAGNTLCLRQPIFKEHRFTNYNLQFKSNIYKM
jgi:hypothetical protein